MISLGEDDLICDLAETYGIFDMRSMPASTVAVLADGLGPKSRIKSRIRGREGADLDTVLRARILDELSLLVWFQTEDGVKGKNRPESVTDALLSHEKQEKDYQTFKSPDDFMEAWRAAGGGA